MSSGIIPVAPFATTRIFWLSIFVGPSVRPALTSISSARLFTRVFGKSNVDFKIHIFYKVKIVETTGVYQCLELNFA